MIKTSVARLAKRLQGTPKTALFGAATLIEFALLTLMVIDRVQILRQGTEVTLQIRPVDPRDFLRGDYVVLNYDISQLPAGPLQDEPAGARNPIVFVKLAPNRDGFYEACRSRQKPRGANPWPCYSRRYLRSKGTHLLRQAAGSLQSRRLFHSRRRGPEARTSPQPAQANGCRGNHAVRARRHQTAAR